MDSKDGAQEHWKGAQNLAMQREIIIAGLGRWQKKTVFVDFIQMTD